MEDHKGIDKYRPINLMTVKMKAMIIVITKELLEILAIIQDLNFLLEVEIHKIWFNNRSS